MQVEILSDIIIKSYNMITGIRAALNDSDLIHFAKPIPFEYPGWSHEVFEFHSRCLSIVFDVTCAKQFVVSCRQSVEVFEFGLNDAFFDICVKPVDPRVTRYRPQTKDDCPGIAASLGGNTILLADGHYRVARRRNAGLRTMRVVVLTEAQTANFMIGLDAHRKAN
jgi:hypothetical protein